MTAADMSTKIDKLLTDLAADSLTIAAVRLVEASNGWCCTVGEFNDHRVIGVIRETPHEALVDGLLDFFRRRELERDLADLI